MIDIQKKTIALNTILSEKKRVGVWGYGIVGKSMVDFFSSFAVPLAVMDRRTLPTELDDVGVRRYTQAEEDEFFAWCDIVIPSPGIPIEKVSAQYHEKMVTELDIFAQRYTHKVVGITGTVGKTSTTHLLSDLLLLYGEKIGTGGNIGYPLMELGKNSSLDTRLIVELSSAQLAYTKTWHPAIAVITNISPNHLDWHGSLENYYRAKCTILAKNDRTQQAILPLSLAEYVRTTIETQSMITWTHNTPPHKDDLKWVAQEESIYYVDRNHTIIRQTNTKKEHLLPSASLSSITFSQNWLIITAVLDLLNHPLSLLPLYSQQLSLPAHRMEKVIIPESNVTVLNDSKSTTIASTLAAIQRIPSSQKIRLLIGGLSKGVDRTELIAALPNNVIQVYCFGKESSSLSTMCATHNRKHYAGATLEEVISRCLEESDQGDHILFSPAGSSQDQFVDYQERGTHFKQLVQKFFSPINDHTKE